MYFKYRHAKSFAHWLRLARLSGDQEHVETFGRLITRLYLHPAVPEDEAVDQEHQSDAACVYQ